MSFSNLYNTVGGQIQQSNSSTTAAITYQFNLGAGQTLGTGSELDVRGAGERRLGRCTRRRVTRIR